MLGLFFIQKPEGAASAPFWPFFGLMLVHCLFYVPTISITNSIAFANLKDPQKDFGPVRLWGTIGWIAAGLAHVLHPGRLGQGADFSKVGFIDWFGAVLGSAKIGAAARAATSYTFIVAGVASLVLAAFSLILPHTPPKPAGPEDATKGRRWPGWRR